jgi:hypothetical protein
MSARPPIYTVVVINGKTQNNRTWGWFADFNDAERLILANGTDIFEMGYYDHAVIEAVPEGVCVLAEDRQWYFADYGEKPDYRDEPKVSRVEKPEWAKQICNWGMG